MSDDVTPEGQVALEDDRPDAAPPEVEKPAPLYSEALSKFAMSLFPTDSPIFLVNAADGSLFYHSSHAQRFGVESDFETFEVAQTAFTRATGDWGRLIPMLRRTRFTLSAFNILLDESTVELRARSRQFLDEFVLAHSTYATRKQIVVMQAVSTPIEVRFKDVSGSEWIAVSAITATNGDNARTFVTYRHIKAFRPDGPGHVAPPTNPAEVPTTKLDLIENVDLVSALIAQHYATFSLPATTAQPGPPYEKAKDAGEKLHATHREFGLRHIKQKKPTSISLYGKTKMGVELTMWEKYVLQADAVEHIVDGLRDQDVGHFSTNAGDWIVIDLLVREGILTIDERLMPLIQRALDLAYIVTTPSLPLPIAMRLGWLTDEPKLECKLDDPEKGFTAGYFYGLTSENREDWDEYDIEEEDPKTGKVITKRKRRPKKWQRFLVTNDHDRTVAFDDDSVEDIIFLAEHFVIRDPGHQATRFPPKTFEMLRHLDDVERQHLAPRGFKLEVYQKYDLAVGLAKKDFVLSHEMGLGKTLEILTYIVVCVTKLGADPAALIVTRKDLIPQWKDEAKKFFGFELQVLDGTAPTNLTGADRRQWQLREYAKVRGLKRAIRQGRARGLWITSYYDLAQTMKRASDEQAPWLHTPRRVYDDSTKQDEWAWKGSVETCPDCKHSYSTSASVCENRRHHRTVEKPGARSRVRCGFTHHEVRLKNYGSLLSTTFAIIALDEATEIGNDSQQAQTICGMRANFRVAATGTPIKNYIGQAFNILGWTLGFTSSKRSQRKKKNQDEGIKDTKPIRFPYPYGQVGRTRFEEKYAVFEQSQVRDKKTGAYSWGGKKPVADTLQRSRLWRELAPVIVARRKEETGVRLPPKKFHTLQTPLGVYQREQMNRWRVDYPKWKAEQDAAEGKTFIGQSRGVFALLGLESKLNWGCVLPCGDDDHEWTKVPVSDWTPMMFKSIETTMKLVAAGKKVVVGSDTPKAVEFITAALEARGVKVVCLSKNGQSLSPKERPELIQEFQNGTAQVLAASMRSIEMGHNIDAASAMVVHGLVWDYKTFHQFENRIHRHSSKKPIDIFIVLPGEESHTIVGRKWATLKDKTAGIARALHGEIELIEDEKPNTEAILQDLVKHGIPSTGKEIDEAEVKAGFQRMPHISAFERDLAFEATLCSWDDAPAIDEIAFNPKAYVDTIPAQEDHPFVTHGEIADALETFFRPWVLAVAKERHDQNAALYQLIVQLQLRYSVLEIDLVIDDTLMAMYGFSWQTSLEVACEEIEKQLKLAGVDLSPLYPPAPEPEVEPEPEPEPTPQPFVDFEPEPISTPAPAPVEEPAPQPTMTIDLVGQIKGLKELLDLGVLTEDEFTEGKAALLASLKQRDEVTA